MCCSRPRPRPPGAAVSPAARSKGLSSDRAAAHGDRRNDHGRLIGQIGRCMVGVSLVARAQVVRGLHRGATAPARRKTSGPRADHPKPRRCSLERSEIPSKTDQPLTRRIRAPVSGFRWQIEGAHSLAGAIAESPAQIHVCAVSVESVTIPRFFLTPKRGRPGFLPSLQTVCGM